MTVKIAPDARRQFIDSSGNPYSGAKLFYYAAGSSTKQNTYTTSVGNVANSNPIVLDSSGRTPYGVWFTSGLSYKEVLAPATDTDPPGSPIFTEDNLSGVNDTSVTVNQWVASALTPTYISTTSFSVPGDQTSELHVGRRLQLTVTAGVVYGRVSASVYGVLTTVTLVMDSGQTLDSGLSSFNWGILTASNSSVPKLVDAEWNGIGLVSLAGTQTVTGAKTFSGAVAMSGATFTPSQTDGIVGTTTNNDANAGSVGEVKDATILVGSAIAILSNVPLNVASISLTAGDWDVYGNVLFLPAATTNITALQGSISTTSVTSDAVSKAIQLTPSGVVTGAVSSGFNVPARRLSLSGATTVYLVGTATFTVSTMAAYGELWARRAR